MARDREYSGTFDDIENPDDFIDDETSEELEETDCEDGDETND